MIKIFCFFLTLSTLSYATIDETNFRIGLQYVRNKYPTIIENLRNHESVNRESLISAFEHDHFLKKEKTKDGHAKFVCDILGTSFCVVDHGTTDITGDREFQGFHADIQQYVNVFKIFYENNKKNLSEVLKSMKAADWKLLVDQEKERYTIYSKKIPDHIQKRRMQKRKK